MTPEQQLVEEIKAHIATLTIGDQHAISVYANMLRTLISADRCAQYAFALVGAEAAESHTPEETAS